MPLKVSRPQALAWRMRRHLLEPVGDPPAEAGGGRVWGVVGRLCGVQAQVASSAELAVRVRRTASSPGEVTRALADGRVVKTWAMRGTLHLLTPELGVAFLSLIADAQPWARPSWQRYFGVTPRVLEALRDAAREALDGNVLTRAELVSAIASRPGLQHVG